MITDIKPDWLWGLALIAVLVFLAVLPTLIAIHRGVDELMLFVLVNVLCCTTVLGWPVAMYMAITWPRKHPRPRKAPRSDRHPMPHRCDLRREPYV
ncbi:superinfection immunity protein [Spirillospora sp. NPDC052242]